MTFFHFPWITLALLSPLVGALSVRRTHDPDLAFRRALLACGLSLAFGLGAAAEFTLAHRAATQDPWDVTGKWLGEPVLVMDALNAPLLPLAGLLYFLTVLATLRTKMRRFSFFRVLLAEATLLATFSCREPWIIIGLLSLKTVQPWIELKQRHRPTRVYRLHALLFVALLVTGQALLEKGSAGGPAFIAAVALLMAAVLMRSGVAPMHCWMTQLFEHATFGTALLFVTPMVGAYATMRLVLPVAPAWALYGIAVLSLFTAVYAAGMALVQRDVRRFFCYLFLSHSSLVLVGLETATPIGLTGALSLWLSVGLSLAGFGLTLRSIEARTGRLSLNEFHGLYEHTPKLAALFLLTGLASIGFPGTAGFVGAELLVEGALQVHPLMGIGIVVVTALNGLAVMHAYFRIFTGTRYVTSIDLRIRWPERVAVLVFTGLILGGGLFPQPGVASRYIAAKQLIEQRRRNLGPSPHAPVEEAELVQAARPAVREAAAEHGP